MRVGFAGTPSFAVAALEGILAAGFDVPLVLTQPDRPRGRGLALQPTEVKAAALAHGVPTAEPPSLRTPEARAAVLATPLDVLVVAAYGLILPKEVLDWPRFGALNVHASLLPRWRGAAPIQRAILAGDAETGVTIMQMDAGLDTGPMIAKVKVPIDGRETAGSLEAKLATVGAGAIVASLRELEHAGRLAATPQPAEGMTYAAKIDRREAAIDWHRSAPEIDRQVRAFSPVPGASTTLHGAVWKIWSAEPLSRSCRAAPGTVLPIQSGALHIACGSGVLAVRELQAAGGRRLPVWAILAGRRLREGDVFTSANGASASPA